MSTKPGNYFTYPFEGDVRSVIDAKFDYALLYSGKRRNIEFFEDVLVPKILAIE